MKNKQHISALMDIAENCAKSNEYLCLLTLKTLREYIETPYLGFSEYDNAEEMLSKVGFPQRCENVLRAC